ncbi:glycine zipper 2TM domain-containing protein [Asticcacaulis sp. 201]|uniref:glycine zipper 2TM domain-containing protein n=1 Tax=Asticcacaulis sp. 201 TaxID=3028787 RepID=UPI002916DB5D|nr:glycine zipper 2TM domain-containing protein [Asticcacaulis sp. 201]MDV6331655.1 glycine zipper 2TM domain-containing protein [Asticcacaulis sp. 201]
MKNRISKACLIASVAVMLAQPVLAQTTPTDSHQATRSDAQPEMRPYSQAELRQAYDRGRADQAADMARDSGLPPPGREPVGYCYQRKSSARTTGTIVGAVLGGVIGNGLSNRWDRGGNTIGGAMVGTMLGSAVGDNSVDCYEQAYYAYDDGYYAPPPPPRGYTTVFFSSEPVYGHYHRYYREPRWDSGWRSGFGYSYGFGRRW